MYLLKVALLLISLFSFCFANEKVLNITYVSHVSKEQPFGQSVHSFAKAAAQDLNIHLTLRYPNQNTDRYSYVKFFKEVIQTEKKPDFIIAVFYRKASQDILKLSQEYDVPVFIVNTNIPLDDIQSVGEPRQKYKNFLGTLAANEFQAGYDLARYLIKKAKKKHPRNSIRMIGLSGPREATEAIERNKGLLKAVEEDKSVILHQILHANWDKDISYEYTNRILKRYEKDIDIIWAASDGMSIGAQKAVQENNENSEILIGGIDWSVEGIQVLKNGDIDATVGGHFMNGGFALVLLYDYFHGIDFYDEVGTKIQLNMSILTQNNVNKYLEKYSSQNWNNIDFRKYSKVLNKKLVKYNFSLESLYDCE